MLYHFSDQPDIARFDPRPAKNTQGNIVWAVNAEKSRNYLFPRDCPRVTFFAGPQTTPADADRFLGSSHAVAAFESAWLPQVLTARLYCYHLPADSFTCIDDGAGYFQSTQSVVPIKVEVIENCLQALASRNVEVRVLPSLWQLHDQVIASTLAFSIIRMRNAAPRPSTPTPQS